MTFLKMYVDVKKTAYYNLVNISTGKSEGIDMVHSIEEISAMNNMRKLADSNYRWIYSESNYNNHMNKQTCQQT